MIEVHSTKSFLNLPCAHAQFFDKEPDGSPGECASVHGYDRSVIITFSGQVDEHGWIVPFGELAAVKKFLEYYFDHTLVLPADDVRAQAVPEDMRGPDGLLANLRVLPYGVSMEMSALFIIERLSTYITEITNGRCYVSRVECREHERNSAFVTLDRATAAALYSRAKAVYGDRVKAACLNEEPNWAYIPPKVILSALNNLT